MSERMMWQDIRKKYPHQWVALEGVIYLDDDGVNVVSGIVVCVMKDEDYIAQQLKFMDEGKDYRYERTDYDGGLRDYTQLCDEDGNHVYIYIS